MFTTKLARFKKGCFNKRPSLPKHTATWDPEIVLRYLNQLGQSTSMNIYDLACKCATLFALASYQRNSTVHSLKANRLKLLHD